MEHVIEIGMSLITPGILAIVGFLWRVNSKLTALEKNVEANSHRISSNSHKLSQHFDKAFTIRKDTS
jgi:hypothetical protein|tara:strand:+ start:1685 stop:1885 length:201 start_codon:yes stop_codon:yes gene_type:complete